MNRRSFLKILGMLPLLKIVPRLQSPDDIFYSDEFDKKLSTPISFGIDYGGYEMPFSYASLVALRGKGSYSVEYTIPLSDLSLEEVAKLRGVTLDE